MFSGFKLSPRHVLQKQHKKNKLQASTSLIPEEMGERLDLGTGKYIKFYLETKSRELLLCLNYYC